jgi:hypothetical protein
VGSTSNELSADLIKKFLEFKANRKILIENQQAATTSVENAK